MSRKKKREMRSTEEVGKDLQKFLKPRWNIGTTFTLKELQEFRGTTGINPEKRILDILIAQGNIRLTTMQKPAGGMGGAVRYFQYTVRVHNPDRLDQGIEQAVKSLNKRRGRKVSRKKLIPPVNHLNGSECKTLKKKVVTLEKKLAKYVLIEHAVNVCPNCHFNLSKFRSKYSALLHEAIEDCKE